MRRRREIKNIRIANIQIKNFVSLPLDFISQADEITNGIAQVLEALSGGDFASLG
jgi:hypothetical protein